MSGQNMVENVPANDIHEATFLVTVQAGIVESDVTLL